MLRRVLPLPVLSFAAILLVGSTVRADDAEPAPESQPEPQPVHVPELSGTWSGSWASYENSHDGPLRATFRRCGKSHYRVHFRGKFWKLFPFDYTVTLRVHRVEDGRVYLCGRHDLGPLFGTFSFYGWATDTCFVATYRSRDDRGRFSMRRCRRCR